MVIVFRPEPATAPEPLSLLRSRRPNQAASQTLGSTISLPRIPGLPSDGILARAARPLFENTPLLVASSRRKPGRQGWHSARAQSSGTRASLQHQAKPGPRQVSAADREPQWHDAGASRYVGEDTECHCEETVGRVQAHVRLTQEDLQAPFSPRSLSSSNTTPTFM